VEPKVSPVLLDGAGLFVRNSVLGYISLGKFGKGGSFVIGLHRSPGLHPFLRRIATP
jgi:hypothetical protein